MSIVIHAAYICPAGLGLLRETPQEASSSSCRLMSCNVLSVLTQPCWTRWSGPHALCACQVVKIEAARAEGGNRLGGWHLRVWGQAVELKDS